MSSSKRPGTVDYSKWDNFEDSDESSEDEQEDFDTGRIHQNNDDNEEEDEESYYDSDDEDEESYSEEEEESSSDDEEDDGNGRIVSPRTISNTHPQRSVNNTQMYRQQEARSVPVPVLPQPSLAALQRAWNTDLSTITRPCSNCFQPDAKYRCSRCQLVRYCNVTCQSTYHPIHKLECIDIGLHQKYWGMFDGGSSKKSGEAGREDVVVKDDFVVLRARRSSKRREYY